MSRFSCTAHLDRAVSWGPSLITGLLVVSATAAPLAAQQEVRIRSSAPSVAYIDGFLTNRPVLGVSIASGELADTLGLTISDVTPDGPAAKAGVEKGARLQAINGVSLRISAADANDPNTRDVGYRRLLRVLDSVKVGDEVTLQLLVGGAVRNVRVATASQASLNGARQFGFTVGDGAGFASRASLGFDVASAENSRDTLGVFIVRVTQGGPADNAGIVEGERVASINGVDVRVPREDAMERGAGAARVLRFQRTLAEVAPDDQIRLRVYGNGRYRDVSVTAGSASEFGGRFKLSPLNSLPRASEPAAPVLLRRMQSGRRAF